MPSFSPARSALLALLAVAICPAADLEIGHFSKSDFGNWTATGTAFRKGPAHGKLLPELEITNAGTPLVISSEIEGDGPTGTLTSPEFTIAKPYIAFRIGGGDYETHTCLNLRIDGKVVKSATGRNSDHLQPQSWNVEPWIGKTASIEVVDQARGHWGHINVSRIVQTDQPEAMPVDKGTLYHEPLRPQFHFTARQWTMDRLNPGMRQEGWMNDINGLIYYEGEYHLFAQRWNKCWIHAVSTDLIHWQELEPAFWEEELDSAVQSGTCVIDYDNTSGLSPDPATPPMIAFWSRNAPQHCLSYSLDKGRTWTHYANNPILEFPERDPKVFWHQPTKRWVMIMYGNDQYHIFTSANLLDWKNEHQPIANAFECPDFFELPVQGNPDLKKWVLIFGDGKYSIGSFSGTRYTQETPRYLGDIGGHNFYATQTFHNTDRGDHRRIQLAWIRGSDFPNMPFSQQASFPCELTLRETANGLRLFRNPISEIEKLHHQTATWSNRQCQPGSPLTLTSKGELFHIKAEVDIPQDAKLKFNIRGFPLTLDSRHIDVGTGPHAVQERIKTIEILIDRASIETFINDGEISATRYFQPTRNTITLESQTTPLTIPSLTLHHLTPIHPPAPSP